MSRASKWCLLAAVIVLVVPFVAKTLIGVWINGFNVMLYGAAFLVVLGIFYDWRLYREFLTMRTTKHGMNMGAMILLVLVLLVCVNYLANNHNKSWDLTQEKLNTLSDQSTTLLKNLKDDVEIKVFIKDAIFEDEKQKLKPALTLFSDSSPHIKIQFINPYVDTDLAMTYLNPLTDRDVTHDFMFVERDGKRARVSEPFDESAIASALTKVTRAGEFKVYFIKGHGERDLESADPQGLKDFATALGETSFKAEALSLIDKKAIPQDAVAVAIIGPSQAYLEEELKILRAYLRDGGHIFIALDPGQHSNIANLIKTLGVQYANNYVVTTQPSEGLGPAGILAGNFDGGSEITRGFVKTPSMAVFYVASELKPAPDKSPAIRVQDLVKSDNTAFTVNDLRQLRDMKTVEQVPEIRPVVMAVESHGKLDDDKAAKDFGAVIFGDSDFLANRMLMFGVNRDVALNAFASFAAQSDLISIRPKLPKGTMLMLSGLGRIGIGWMALLLPLGLIISSIVIWFRRRGA